MLRIAPLLSIVVLLQIATQCRTQPLPAITGLVHMTKDWKPVLYLVQPRSFLEIASNYSGVVVDSAVLDSNGRFQFRHLPPQTGQVLYELCIQQADGRFQNQLIDDNPLLSNYMPVVLQQDDRLEIRAEAARFQATFVIISPTAVNKAILQLRDIRHAAYAAQHALIGEAATEETLLATEDAVYQYRRPLMAFADTCTALWPALVAVRWVSPAGDYERVPEFLFGQCEKQHLKSLDNQFVMQLCKLGDRDRLPVLTGDDFPNAALPMANGDTVLLHTLLGSRLTIVDIWASWCAPCRHENREVLAPLWARFQEKGLQILGYSIDSSPTAWRSAIAKDAAAWPQASHLSGDAAPLLETIRITTIPANFILDVQGKIVAKNLHGDALKVFLEDYLK